MTRGSNKGTKTTEYERFKGNEQEYINTRVYEYEPKPKMRKDWIWWLLAVIVLSTSIYYVVDHMVESRDAVYDSEQIARLSAREAVEQMFDEDENGELSYIRRDLTVEEYNQIKEKVDGVPDSSEKVQINSLMRLAGEQLESQEEALELVNSIKTESGEPNVDVSKKGLLEDMRKFPRKYNPEYARELEQEYVEIASIIERANDLQARIRELAVNDDGYLDKYELDSLDTQVENLPFSDRKSQLTYDMKALYQEYDRQQEELEKQREEEDRRRAEQERYRQEQEEIRRQDAERRAERQAEEEAREQAIIEQQLEEERQIQAELDRIEREERERIEQLEREQQEREAQQRAEAEARLEQQRIEEEARLERERLEREEQQRIEEEARLQQQGSGNGQ